MWLTKSASLLVLILGTIQYTLLLGEFYEDWYETVEHEVSLLTDQEVSVLNYMSLLNAYPSTKPEDVIPADSIEAVKTALDNPLNAKINHEEVSHSLRKLNMHSTPASADKILPIMLKKGGKALESALLDTLNTCWIDGVYPRPRPWARA